MRIYAILVFTELLNFYSFQISALQHQREDLKKPLKVIFKGEEGIDEGGVQKEFFQLIIRQTFDLNYGMFTYEEDTRCFWSTPAPQYWSCAQTYSSYGVSVRFRYEDGWYGCREVVVSISFFETRDSFSDRLGHSDKRFSSTALENTREFNLIGKVVDLAATTSGFVNANNKRPDNLSWPKGQRVSELFVVCAHARLTLADSRTRHLQLSHPGRALPHGGVPEADGIDPVAG